MNYSINSDSLSVWTNFITIVFSTLLLALTYRLYSPRDYEPYQTGKKYSCQPDPFQEEAQIHEKPTARHGHVTEC